jgi:hypothetical protein
MKKTNQYQKGESSVIPHPYIYEQLNASHQAQIQHEMQQIRMLAQVRQRPALARLAIGRLGRVLIVLGSYMQRAGQQNEASLVLNVDTPNP